MKPGLSGPFIEPRCDLVQFRLRVLIKLRAVGQVLTQESVRVFVGTALPRTSRVAEVDFHIGGDREVFVVCQLHAAVPGERLA